jgi:hypothetical protein
MISYKVPIHRVAAVLPIIAKIRDRRGATLNELHSLLIVAAKVPHIATALSHAMEGK